MSDNFVEWLQKVKGLSKEKAEAMGDLWCSFTNKFKRKNRDFCGANDSIKAKVIRHKD